MLTGVSDDPEFLARGRVNTPSDDGHNVVNTSALSAGNSTSVFKDLGGVNTGSDYVKCLAECSAFDYLVHERRFPS